ncbi:MAG TPA: hypothetical protein PLC42_07820 [Parachlamydiaceae bacterium]|nr:hypothetical protein [Parachlamydiaceae bacterium]
MLGSFYYRTKNFEKSAEIFLSLEKKYQAEQLLSEAAKALYKAALSLSSLPMQEEGARALRVRLYTEYPDSEYAAKSYFFCYSFQEYLEGNPAAIKHVKNFLKRFSKTPLLIDACYLLGLDSKRDRKTSEGRWISKKNLSLAIHYFQKAENYFEEFLAEDLLEEESTHYLTMRYLSAFERAFSNFKIAEDSSSFGKKEIYLEYARSAFLRICQDFNDPENLLVKMEPYPHLLEESSYYLGMTYLKAGQELLAKETFLEMVNRYQTLAVTRGYFLSKALYELGMIAMSEKEPSLAIEFLLRAEDAAKGKILNSEERLDLWIQQGLCFLELLQFDSAILLFSKAVNDEAVSQARLKAMFLRAFAYEEQGRKELSKKQLEALAKKGGEWGLKAKLKLGRVIN